jgi:rhamnosyltransferase
MTPLAAIIMRSKNEMPHVRTALDMLKRQTFRDYELFAVDSGSTDGSVELLHGAHLVEIPPEGYSPGQVLNDAIARTGHSIIVLLNADAIPLSDSWLETLLLPILGNEADATYSRQVARPGAPFIVAYDYQRAYKASTGFSAVACAFKRALWEQHKFRPQGYAEDIAWANACRENGARIRLAADSIVEHSHHYTLKELFKKRYRQAATFADGPNLGKQIYRCTRELVRDFLFACRKLKLHTIPYNIAYRITIHAALYRGLKEKAE